MTSFFCAYKRVRPDQTKNIWRLCWLAPLWIAGTCSAMGLQVEPAQAECGVPAPAVSAPPEAARHRLQQSQAVSGQRDIAWAWLGSPTQRYPHGALGSSAHAASLHVLARTPEGGLQQVIYRLPVRRVFEDRVPRLADLDGDGRDEIILVEADAFDGAAMVVFGLRASATGPAAGGPQAARHLAELARSPHAGSTFRWLNPVGVADFDGDGRLDLASVITPHVGGVLTLYHYRPPQLEPYARAMDVSNHRMGMLEQRLAVIVEQAGQRPTIVLPDMQLGALHALRWVAPGKWQELADPRSLPARVERLTPLAGGGCLLLANASWWRVSLMP
ncbi:MAG: VCBS repeat-containing protein [Polaromonas sp.]|nr:VCBS repeat-containing protein [Polaromonas sp.]MDP3752475.1 VCBS repeat-containing protein [Polaromonas sp.]